MRGTRLMNSKVKRILVIDTDEGVVWARLDRVIETKEDGLVEIYKFIEYYHTLRDAMKDLYDTEIDL